MSFAKAIYIIQNTTWTFDEYIRLKKARCGSVKEWMNDDPNPFKLYPDLKDFAHEIWDNIVPLDVKTIFNKEIPKGLPFWSKTEDRLRVMFFHVGPSNIMNNIKTKKLLDTYKHNGGKVQSDIYNLYSFPSKEIGLNDNQEVFIFQCWCPSTEKEHWLYVSNQEPFARSGSYSAKNAVAWACLLPQDVEVTEIFRQGEVFTFSYKGQLPKGEVRLRHATPDEYWNKLKVAT